jgi:hypothetical protein
MHRVIDRGDRPTQELDVTDQVRMNTQRIADLIERLHAAEARIEASEAQAAIDREILASLHIDEDLMRGHVTQLEQALQSSRTIGTAVGIVMASRNIDRETALAVLKRASSETNVKLRDLCAEMVDGAGSSDG